MKEKGGRNTTEEGEEGRSGEEEGGRGILNLC
jgi:hypothetical protein